MRLEGMMALVTGETSGIGRGVVERFTREGAVIFFTGRRQSLGAEIASATGAVFVGADATSEDDSRRGGLEHRQYRVGRRASSRLASERCMTAAAVFLASDASTFINGADLIIDGGLPGEHRFSDRKAGANRFGADLA